MKGHNICSSTEEKLLGVKIDSQFIFESHVSTLCKKASQNLHALSRITNYMDFEKRKCLMKITSQFNYGPLIWMFLSRKLNSRYDEILQKDNFVRVHHRNVQFLTTETFKVKMILHEIL